MMGKRLSLLDRRGGGVAAWSAWPLHLMALSLLLAVVLSALAASPARAQATTSKHVPMAWGSNHAGQLGDGSKTDRLSPLQTKDLANVQDVAAGRFHSVALKNDGTVWAWGSNFHGQLGDGTTTDRTRPVKVQGLDGQKVVKIAAGEGHNLALTEGGDVYAWGLNADGQLGDGTMTDRTRPVLVQGINIPTLARDISAGKFHSFAVLENTGSGGDPLVAWGLNGDGQLGDGTTTKRLTPVAVDLPWFSLGGSEIKEIEGAGYHSLLVKDDGTAYAWGNNRDRQLGAGSTADFHSRPVQMTGGFTNVARLSGGDFYSVAVRNDGTAWAVGNNKFGQLGDGSTVNSATAVQVSGLSGLVDVDAGANHSLVRKSDGSVWAWGSNTYGRLGDGTSTLRSTPVRVLGVSNVAGISAGVFHSLAVKPDTWKPWVARVSPVENATGIGVGANVNAYFGEPMNASTVAASVKLYRVGYTKPLPAVVAYDPTTMSATLNPNTNLVRGAKYKAVVSTGARDLVGNPLDQDLSVSGNQPKEWSFKVRN